MFVANMLYPWEPFYQRCPAIEPSSPSDPSALLSWGFNFVDTLYKRTMAYDESRECFWVACSDPDTPIKAHDKGNGVVDSITTQVIPAAWGVAIDTEGYLWVSDMENDKIYKIDLSSTGIDNSKLKIKTNSSVWYRDNRFTNSIMIYGSGFSDNATISVYNAAGKEVLTQQFNNPFVLNKGSVTCGMYIVQVTEQDYISKTMKLMINK